MRPYRAVLSRQGAKSLFWWAFGLLAWTHLLYSGFLVALGKRSAAAAPPGLDGRDELPMVSLIIPAYNEETVIADKVRNALALDWPRERLEVVVAVDGGAEPSADRTAINARTAGADTVLELPRGGKIRSQDAAVESTKGDIIAFSDANSVWAPDALRQLVGTFEDPEVGYVCGQVNFVNESGTNQEGLYWRYEMWIRARESAAASVTAGNGAIYAVRRAAYIEVDPVMGHDLSFPFNMVKRGWRAVYAPTAKAREKMVPSIEGEWKRKRRMMSHAWPIVLRGGLASPRGYKPLYGFMILSHRILRYASPFLHILLAAATLRLLGDRRTYRLAAAAQVALLGCAVAGGRSKVRPLLIARYYVLTTAAIAAGLFDHLRHGTAAGWEAPEGTR